METEILEARARVGVDLERARQWFLDLKTHPERYAFETHEGFTFTRGDFGQTGAQFETREAFHGLRIRLRFELVELGAQSFRFRLLKPPFPIWGAFVLEPVTAGEVVLRLVIGSAGPMGRLVLSFPPIRNAVLGQIRGEVEHIRDAIEATYLQ